MSHPVLSRGRFAGMVAALTAPTAVVLAALAAAGLAPPAAAVVGVAAVAAALALVLARYRTDAVAVADWFDRLGRDDDAARPPRPATGIGRAVVGAVSGMQRAWRQRARRMTAQIAEASVVLEALNDPVVVLDRERQVVRANRAARDLLGGPMTGRDFADRLRHPAVLAAVDAVLGGADARVVEYGRSIPVEQVFEVRVTPFAGEAVEGEPPPAAAIVTLHDLTAIRRAEQMRADFVANASHELRTPLSSLIGFIETLRGPARDDPEARDRFLTIMGEQAGRMARLVGDLLSLSRIELDEHTPPAGGVDLPRLLRGVVAALEMKAARRDLRLHVEAPAALAPVPGDEDQLFQVFQNLVDNAINYTRPGTEVRITVERASPGRLRGPAVAVAVRDQGEGIDKAHLPRLTERFYRVDPARSRAVGGTGLGLAIVKHIVSRHRGRLMIESTPGKGSTFTVLLPARAGRGAETPDAAATVKKL